MIIRYREGDVVEITLNGKPMLVEVVNHDDPAIVVVRHPSTGNEFKVGYYHTRIPEEK